LALSDFLRLRAGLVAIGATADIGGHPALAGSVDNDPKQSFDDHFAVLHGSISRAMAW
jgi:hypothetical protein